jgi:hypothetical protein
MHFNRKSAIVYIEPEQGVVGEMRLVELIDICVERLGHFRRVGNVASGREKGDAYCIALFE